MPLPYVILTETGYTVKQNDRMRSWLTKPPILGRVNVNLPYQAYLCTKLKMWWYSLSQMRWQLSPLREPLDWTDHITVRDINETIPGKSLPQRREVSFASANDGGSSREKSRFSPNLRLIHPDINPVGALKRKSDVFIAMIQRDILHNQTNAPSGQSEGSVFLFAWYYFRLRGKGISFASCFAFFLV